MAAAWFVLETTGSAARAGLVAFAATLPQRRAQHSAGLLTVSAVYLAAILSPLVVPAFRDWAD